MRRAQKAHKPTNRPRAKTKRIAFAPIDQPPFSCDARAAPAANHLEMIIAFKTGHCGIKIRSLRVKQASARFRALSLVRTLLLTDQDTRILPESTKAALCTIQ